MSKVHITFNQLDTSKLISSSIMLAKVVFGKDTLEKFLLETHYYTVITFLITKYCNHK